MTTRVVLLIALFAVSVAAPAAAEIYRCTGPDGQVRFTGDASQCPGAKKHEPKKKIQSVAPAARLEPAPRPAVAEPRARRQTINDEADAARWRTKKQRAEQQLAQLDQQLPTLRKVAGWCNRGDGVYTTDDLGRRRTIECSDVQEEYGRLQEAHAELSQYLAEGLEEECRRAGCLPGWIR